MIPDTVDTDVTILGPCTDRTWHARLPNGRSVLVFRPEGSEPIHLDAGGSVRVRLTVCDFSRAMLLDVKEAVQAI